MLYQKKPYGIPRCRRNAGETDGRWIPGAFGEGTLEAYTGREICGDAEHSALIAFTIPEKESWKFHIIASHSDSPSFKIKENPEIVVEKTYVKLNVEKYGGMLMAPCLTVRCPLPEE